jgi:CubicO group peptidase (beta-lactamase class C family)
VLPDYGYFWIRYGDEAFAALGLFGQAIYVNPAEKVVIAMHSARGRDADRDRMMQDRRLDQAMYAALTAAAAK